MFVNSIEPLQQFLALLGLHLHDLPRESLKQFRGFADKPFFLGDLQHPGLDFGLDVAQGYRQHRIGVQLQDPELRRELRQRRIHMRTHGEGELVCIAQRSFRIVFQTSRQLDGKT